MLLGDDRRQDDRRLTADKFDNLLAAGDGVQDSGIDPGDTHAVCAAIARGGGEGWCARESMSGVFEDAKLEMLLSGPRGTGTWSNGKGRHSACAWGCSETG